MDKNDIFYLVQESLKFNDKEFTDSGKASTYAQNPNLTKERIKTKCKVLRKKIKVFIEEEV